MTHRTWNGINLLPTFPGSGPPESHVEEKARFDKVLDNVEKRRTTNTPVMVELGAYWALWTIIFGKRFPGAKLIIVEPNINKLAVGLGNLHLNDLVASVHHNCVSIGTTVGESFDVAEISLDDIINRNNVEAIDVLHLDTQGAEYGLHEEIDEKLTSGKIKNVVMASHFKDQHDKMVAQLRKSGHEVSAIWSGESDGEIIASPAGVEPATLGFEDRRSAN